MKLPKFLRNKVEAFTKGVDAQQPRPFMATPTEETHIYMRPEDTERRLNESIESYNARVPQYFQPVKSVTKSYRGTDL